MYDVIILRPLSFIKNYTKQKTWKIPVIPGGGRSSYPIYCSTIIGLNLANFEMFTEGCSILFKQYRSTRHQFELKMLTASNILPEEQKRFHSLSLSTFM